MKKWEVEEDVDAIFRDLDTNNDDEVTWKEFMIRTFGFPEERTYCLFSFSGLNQALGLT